eukprot:gnl/MRDRNA2_/MRDRNA2_19746_c0_seq1.p1 gnl/MRDRNA2_/MRDRNA2_19746_c0~~gnl/MRDRNA2_/MRDRNA2_19746_c0_seq1.p1  ORF type:complete len:114 (+),score=9.82 gnl/MRDRNA2_/MRDRNA2_19746_c0_seq1:84-425(+)
MPGTDAIRAWPSSEVRRKRALLFCLLTIVVLSLALCFLGQPPRCSRSLHAKARSPGLGYEQKELFRDMRSVGCLLCGFVVMHLLDIAKKHCQAPNEVRVESINSDARIQLCFL